MPSQSPPTQHKDEDVIKCVLYEMFTLALSIQTLEQCTWPDNLCYELFPSGSLKQVRFDPAEIVKGAAEVKLRILYDFLHVPSTHPDDLEAGPLVLKYGPVAFSNKAAIDGLWTKESASKYRAHLTGERITKSPSIRQFKFADGQRDVIKIAKLLLEDTAVLVTHVVGHSSFPGLSDWGAGYLKMYLEVMAKLT